MIDQAEPHLERAGDRIGLRRDGAHPRFRGDRRVVGESDGDCRVSRRGAQDLGRDVEHGVAPVLSRDGEDRLSGLNHLTGFGEARGNRALDIGPKFGEAYPVLSDVQLRGRVVDPRLRRLQSLLRRIEDRARCEAALHQVVLAVEIVLRLRHLGLGGGERGLRRAQPVELVLRIELGQHLIGLDLIADLALPLDDPSADRGRRDSPRFRLECPQ